MSEFSTEMVDKLMAAELGELPDSIEPRKYSTQRDIIAVLELKIMHFEDHVDELDSQKRIVENGIRWEVEILAEDKDNKLTNEAKRQAKYITLAEGNGELQKLNGELRIFRKEIKKLKIELGNEQRAYTLKVSVGDKK